MKTLTVHAPHAGLTMTIGLYAGTGDKALVRALASRVRLPPSYDDGSDSFFLTDGPAQDSMLMPLCADGLPDGKTLTLHVNPPPTVHRGLRHSAESGPSQPMMETASAPAGAPAGAPASAPAAAIVAEATVLSVDGTLAPDKSDEQDAGLGVLKAATKLQSSMRAVLTRRRIAKELQAKRRRSHVCGEFGVFMLDSFYEIVERLHLSKWLPGFISPYDRVGHKERDDDALYGMERMSRLSTDLANERTLLAWVRTVLSIMRTAFATLAVVGVNGSWESVQQIAVWLMTLLMCVAAYVGMYRFYRINKIVSLKKIPPSFGKNRVPIWPVNFVLGLSLVTVAFAMMFNGFDK